MGPPSPSNYQNGVASPFAPIFVDTGNIRGVDHFQLFDPEFAIILGPLSLQSEYAFAAVHRSGRPDLFFNGYMAQLSYFLTGEHRPYDRKQGIHGRVQPFEDFPEYLAAFPFAGSSAAKPGAAVTAAKTMATRTALPMEQLANLLMECRSVSG